MTLTSEKRVDILWSRGIGRLSDETPQVTVEAILFCVRTRGLIALQEASTIERLNRCDEDARAKINKRLAKLFPEAA